MLVYDLGRIDLFRLGHNVRYIQCALLSVEELLMVDIGTVMLDVFADLEGV